MARLESPSAERNKEPIAEVLRRVLPSEGVVLEIASGSGVHTVHFAKSFPKLAFQPSDPGQMARGSVDSRREEEGLDNVWSALEIDVTEPGWAAPLVGRGITAILCINMIHIAPFEATQGLFAGAAALLPTGAPCVLYGPYSFGGRFLVESNAAFDESLRSRNPSWGVRDLDEVTEVAEAAGFERREVAEMPANNHVVVFARK